MKYRLVLATEFEARDNVEAREKTRCLLTSVVNTNERILVINDDVEVKLQQLNVGAPPEKVELVL